MRVINDAEMQGMSAIRGEGVELVLTLGTGMGSALFVDGTVVPNLELGHHPFEKNKTYEQRLGKSALVEIGDGAWLRTEVGELHLVAFEGARLRVGPECLLNG